MRYLRLASTVLASTVLACACGGGEPDVVDAAVIDAATTDATAKDAAASDAAASDAGGGDAGPPPRAEVLHNADGANDEYAAIGRANVGLTCTATLLDVGGDDDAPAYALMAGHCTGWWESDEASVERPLREPGEIVFRFFTDTVDAHRSVSVTTAAYASMRLTDVAIARLDTTVGALRAEGIEGIPLSSTMPASGSAIVNIGAPLATGSDPEEHLRRGRCTLGATVDLVEFEWLWPRAVIHDCPDIRTGSSGSPLLDASGAIFAIVHTTASEPAHALCHLGRPCELAAAGPVSVDGRSYAIPVANLGACFEGGVLALDAEGCELEAGPFVDSDRETPRYVQGSASPRMTIALSEREGLTHYRAKTGPAESTNCRSDAGYGEVRAIATAPTFDAPLPASDALTVACLRGGSESAIEPASRAVAWIVATDSTPPALPLPVQYTIDGDQAQFQVWVENPTYASYDQKSGPAAQTDCADPEGYQFVNVRFGRFTVPRAGGPTRVCVVASDFADNRSAPQEWVLFD